jgi:prevent-host-death family protein
MMRRLTVTEARQGFLTLAEDLARDPREVVGITRRGRPVMALLSAELYESLVETLDLLGDEAEAARLRRALREVKGGKVAGRRRQP